MTKSARSLPSPSSVLGARARWAALAIAIALAASLLAAPPAGAVVKTVEGMAVGMQPRVADEVLDGTLRLNELYEFFEAPAAEGFANNEGNPVLHGANVYAIFWDPTAGQYYHPDWQQAIGEFLEEESVAGTPLDNVFAVDSQYTDRTNRPATDSLSLKDVATDTDAYPTAGCTDPHPLKEWKIAHTHAITCLTSAQVQQEVQNYVALRGLPKGMDTVYYLMTPPGVTVCLDATAEHCSDFSAGKVEEEQEKFSSVSYQNSFCSYHAAINPDNVPTGDGNTILYGVIPWTAGGQGDGDLAPSDEKGAFQCQDGGFDPSTSPIEQHELKPHEEEPNQKSCPTGDGYCDYGLADLIVNQIAVEEQNIVTDPLLSSWQDTSGNELTDECRNFFAPIAGGGSSPQEGSLAGSLYNQSLSRADYYLNDAFNLAAEKLQYPGVPCLTGINLIPEFSVPSPVNTGETVGFDGMESTITLNAGVGFSAGGSPQAKYATYTWNFGDGSPTVSGYAPGAPPCETPWLAPCAASVFHTYTYGGTYPVTLTVTDVGGNTASVTRIVNVNGPLPPPPPAAAGANAPGSATGGSSSPGSASVTVPLPVAAAAILSRTLKNALRGGLVVRYSVNEQVAGHFEVLLSRSLARSLKIGGAPATGLPAGTPPQVVIAKAILVTTAGGRNTVKIEFSKQTAARLGRLRKVTLMLRLIVRNAASHQPATTTVLTKVTLGG